MLKWGVGIRKGREPIENEWPWPGGISIGLVFDRLGEQILCAPNGQWEMFP
jgi:hypothetical protein